MAPYAIRGGIAHATPMAQDYAYGHAYAHTDGVPEVSHATE
jgi:hypothetical protein